MKTEKQEQVLRCMRDVLEQNGYRAEILQNDAAPMMLRAEAARQGKVQKDVTVECCFIPMPLPGEDVGLLQFFVTLFSSVPKINHAQIKRACEYCNSFTALGAFGFFPEAGQLYLKQNTVFYGTWELEKSVTFIADNISLLLASTARFIDGMASVAFSGQPVQAVIDQELFPKL